MGYKLAYGAEMAALQNCATKGAMCDEPLKLAVDAVKSWNHCLDGILLEHKINFLWPDLPEDARFVSQMHFRAQLAEDLLSQGGYINQMIETCLPGQIVVVP